MEGVGSWGLSRTHQGPLAGGQHLCIVLGWEQVTVAIGRHRKCAVPHAGLYRLERQPEPAVLGACRAPRAEEMPQRVEATILRLPIDDDAGRDLQRVPMTPADVH